MRNSKYFLLLLLTVMVLSFLIWNILAPFTFDKFDAWIAQRENSDTPSSSVVIVKVDNQTLDALQDTDLRILTLQKKIFRDLTEKLYLHGAKTVGFDIVFANKSPDLPELVAVLKKYPQTVIGAKIGGEDGERVLPLPDLGDTTWGAIDTISGPTTALADRFVPLRSVHDRAVEAFPVALWRKYTNLRGKGYFGEEKYFLNPIYSLPLTENTKTALIRFSGGPHTFQSYSLIDVLRDKVPRTAFEGKIVLVGEYGTLIHDEFFTPADPSEAMPGVEIHANTLSMLLSGKTLRSASILEVGIVMAIASVLMLGIALSFSYPIAWAIYLGFFGGSAILSRFLVTEIHGILFPSSAIIVAATIAFFCSWIWKYFIVNKESRFIQKAFSHYLSPEMVHRLAENPESLRLGGSKKRITILFSDLEGFTTLSEELGTEGIFSVLSQHLSDMTDIIMQNKGMVDKYIGDAIMAFWGAPADIEHQEAVAVKAALDMRNGMRILNDSLAKQGLPLLRVRIGMNTGEAIVGNIGSKKRFNYTAIGDTVNLASRLEGVNKEYGTDFIVSGETHAHAQDACQWQLIDRIFVKGKEQAVEIWTPLDVNDVQKALVRENYTLAFEKYRIGKYEAAHELFSAISFFPPAQALAKRCLQAHEGKIHIENGVYIFDHK